MSFVTTTLRDTTVNAAAAGGFVTVKAIFDNDRLEITIDRIGNSYEFGVNQQLSQDQIDALAEGGDWELSFDASSPKGSKTFHVFLGEVGGGWNRYWAADGDGLVTVDGEMKTYTLRTNIIQTWNNMQLSFEWLFNFGS